MCTCPADIQNLSEMCEECQQQLYENAPVPIEVDEAEELLKEQE